MMQAGDDGPMGLAQQTARRICGDITDRKLAEILAVGGDLVALEEAVAWAGGDDETRPQRHLPLSGAAACFYEILTADDEYAEEEPGPAGD